MMTMNFFTGLLFAVLLSTAAAHRALPPGITCGSQFSSAESPLVIPNPKIPWANYHIHTCEHPIMWFEAALDAGQDALFSILIPELDRFQEARMTVVFLHESLSSLTDQTDTAIPESVLDYAATNNLGGVVYHSPDDQSTCDHLTSQSMINAVTVKDGRCHFYENFGASNTWAILDQKFQAPETGTYKIAIFEKNNMEIKASFGCCGDGAEDFITNFNIPQTTCPACGSDSLFNPTWTQLFFETGTMAEFGGFPTGEICPSSDNDMVAITTEYPSGDKCPPVKDLSDTPSQPTSCTLGCNNDGECHSHNVFGECNHQLEWDIVPKFGNARVKRVAIFKGDKITFQSMPGSALANNLYELTDESNLDQCNFDGADAVANVEAIAIGHEIMFDQAGTFYFASGIGCLTSFETSGGAPPVDASTCLCSIGQKLAVEVKDISDGLRCHSHEQIQDSNTLETTSNCHCHSYEMIVCPENETPDDTLYVEHIEEIETFCTGILDGTDADCPYKCFQPIEVLHLHYIECPTRSVDPTYIAVNATNKCHIAATAPETIDECPEVVLGASNPNKNDQEDASDNNSSSDDPNSSASLLAIASKYFAAILAAFASVLM